MQHMRIIQPKPQGGENSWIVKDLLALNNTGRSEAVSAIIKMVRDLKENGRGSRYIRAMKGSPLMELKTASRGGLKGGARVYFFWSAEGAAVLCAAETKAEDDPDLELIWRTVFIYKGW